MREVVVDCSGIRSPDEFWQRYLDAAKPEDAEMFGRNFDAFWDAIEGGGPGWPGNVSLIFTRATELSKIQMLSGDASFLDALRTIADEASVVSVKLVD